MAGFEMFPLYKTQSLVGEESTNKVHWAKPIIIMIDGWFE